MKLLHFEKIIDHVKWLFFLQRPGGQRGGQKAGFHDMLKYLAITKDFSLLYKTNRFHVAVILGDPGAVSGGEKKSKRARKKFGRRKVTND